MPRRASDPVVLWEAPAEHSIRKAARGSRWDRMMATVTVAGAAVVFGWMVALGVMPFDPVGGTTFLGAVLVTGAYGVGMFWVTAFSLRGKYPVVRTDGLEVPAASWHQVRLARLISWTEAEGLKVERPDLLQKVGRAKTGPDLRIEVRVRGGEVVRLTYLSSAGVPFAVHDGLAEVLEREWGRRSGR